MKNKAICNGYEYENIISYDLQNNTEMIQFQRKLDTFLNWYDEADEIYEENSNGHLHFKINNIEIKCNIQKLSKRYRNII